MVGTGIQLRVPTGKFSRFLGVMKVRAMASFSFFWYVSMLVGHGSRKIDLAVWPIVSIIVAAAEKSSSTGLCKEGSIFWCATASIVPNLLTQRLFIPTKAFQSYTDHIAS